MRQLGVLAKYWLPGAVKTRLAKSIGEDAASHLYRLFLEATLQRFSRAADRRVLVYSPAERHTEFSELAGCRWRLAVQRDGDLGQRMRRYFQDAFDGAARLAVLIGSDSPTLPLDVVQRAFELLEQHRVVLGPSSDGGYYLVGLQAPVIDGLFDKIPWSTGEVFGTVAVLHQERIGFAKLPAWYDVDDYPALLRLRTELAGGARDESLDRLAAALGSVIDD